MHQILVWYTCNIYTTYANTNTPTWYSCSISYMYAAFKITGPRDAKEHIQTYSLIRQTFGVSHVQLAAQRNLLMCQKLVWYSAIYYLFGNAPKYFFWYVCNVLLIPTLIHQRGIVVPFPMYVTFEIAWPRDAKKKVLFSLYSLIRQNLMYRPCNLLQPTIYLEMRQILVWYACNILLIQTIIRQYATQYTCIYQSSKKVVEEERNVVTLSHRFRWNDNLELVVFVMT